MSVHPFPVPTGCTTVPSASSAAAAAGPPPPTAAADDDAANVPAAGRPGSSPGPVRCHGESCYCQRSGPVVKSAIMTSIAIQSDSVL